MPPKRLGDILLESNAITHAQLEQGLERQQQSGERLGEALASLGFITEQDIIDVLEFQLGLRHVKILESPPDESVLNLIPKVLAYRYQAIPYRQEGDVLVVAMSDPLNLVALDDLRMRTGKEIKPVIATKDDVSRAIQRYYGFTELSENEKSRIQVAATAEELLDEQAANQAPVVKVVNSILEQAVKDRASDIHIEPGEFGVRIRFRVDGILIQVTNLPSNVLNAVVSRIKIIAGLDIAEKRVPQDGRIQQKICGREIDIRVSTFPTVFGEKLVLRLLDRNMQLLQLEELGFSSDIRENLRRLLAKTHGMILITGPTGSGKTTTLYSMLNQINTVEKNIITIEDPVEYVLEGINQTSVNLRAGLTFPAGLRSILRQDPDIVMVGEIRDLETAQIAVRAANTGHLLISTLHTNDAPSALTRLMDMGIEPFLVASSVHAVIGQRLVRRICRKCIEEYQLPAKAPERRLLQIDPDEPFTAYRGKGCNKCGNTGYMGRLAVAEVLFVSEGVRRMIVQKESSSSIMDYVVNREGFKTILENGVEKIREGTTTINEIARCI